MGGCVRRCGRLAGGLQQEDLVLQVHDDAGGRFGSDALHAFQQGRILPADDVY